MEVGKKTVVNFRIYAVSVELPNTYWVGIKYMNFGHGRFIKGIIYSTSKLNIIGFYIRRSSFWIGMKSYFIRYQNLNIPLGESFSRIFVNELRPRKIPTEWGTHTRAVLLVLLRRINPSWLVPVEKITNFWFFCIFTSLELGCSQDRAKTEQKRLSFLRFQQKKFRILSRGILKSCVNTIRHFCCNTGYGLTSARAEVMEALRALKKTNGKYRQLTLNFVAQPSFLKHVYAIVKHQGPTILLGGQASLPVIPESWFYSVGPLLKTGLYQFTKIPHKTVPSTSQSSERVCAVILQDKIIQEAARSVLEVIFRKCCKPVSFKRVTFSSSETHHSLLKDIKTRWVGVPWYIKVNLQNNFDSKNKQILKAVLEEYIQDTSFVSILCKILKMNPVSKTIFFRSKIENSSWSIASLASLLSDFYYLKVDNFLQVLMSRSKKTLYSRGIQGGPKKMHLTKREKLVLPLTYQFRLLRKRQQEAQRSEYRDVRIRCSRHTTTLLIGIKGSKSAALRIKRLILDYVGLFLGLKVDETATCLTHSFYGAVNFLGTTIKNIMEPSRYGTGRIRCWALQKQTIASFNRTTLQNKRCFLQTKLLFFKTLKQRLVRNSQLLRYLMFTGQFCENLLKKKERSNSRELLRRAANKSLIIFAASKSTKKYRTDELDSGLLFNIFLNFWRNSQFRQEVCAWTRPCVYKWSYRCTNKYSFLFSAQAFILFQLPVRLFKPVEVVKVGYTRAVTFLPSQHDFFKLKIEVNLVFIFQKLIKLGVISQKKKPQSKNNMLSFSDYNIIVYYRMLAMRLVGYYHGIVDSPGTIVRVIRYHLRLSLIRTLKNKHKLTTSDVNKKYGDPISCFSSVGQKAVFSGYTELSFSKTVLVS